MRLYWQAAAAALEARYKPLVETASNVSAEAKHRCPDTLIRYALPYA